jgi:hypothetical protein
VLKFPHDNSPHTSMHQILIPEYIEFVQCAPLSYRVPRWMSVCDRSVHPTNCLRHNPIWNYWNVCLGKMEDSGNWTWSMVHPVSVRVARMMQYLSGLWSFLGFIDLWIMQDEGTFALLCWSLLNCQLEVLELHLFELLYAVFDFPGCRLPCGQIEILDSLNV